MQRPRTLAVAAITLMMLAACGGAPATQAPAATPTGAPAGGGGAVAIIDFGFNPAATTATVGQEITWTNTGAAPHTVTFSGGPDSGSIAPGGTFKHAFTAAGEFSYVCNFHSSMTGTVTVSG